MVAILDADKEGFLRSETSLIQTIGRAARNLNGQVVMYADNMTDSMQRAISETERRRALQRQYNLDHGITPISVAKGISDILSLVGRGDNTSPMPGKGSRNRKRDKSDFSNLPKEEIARLVRVLTAEMNEASADLRFEYAAKLRDEINDLKKELKEVSV